MIAGKLPLLAALFALADGAALPGERSPFRLSAGMDRRLRAQAIRDRTGWVYARCREVAAKSDREIEALVREHEEVQRVKEATKS